MMIDKCNTEWDQSFVDRLKYLIDPIVRTLHCWILHSGLLNDSTEEKLSASGLAIFLARHHHNRRDKIKQIPIEVKDKPAEAREGWQLAADSLLPISAVTLSLLLFISHFTFNHFQSSHKVSSSSLNLKEPTDRIHPGISSTSIHRPTSDVYSNSQECRRTE